MPTFSYPARLKSDPFEDGRAAIGVRFPDFDEAITFGEDHTEALAQAADCLEVAVAHRMARGEDVPLPSRAKTGEALVPLSPELAAKLALYVEARSAGLSKTALAAKLGVAESEASRLLDPSHPSKLTRVNAALRSFGKNLVISVERDARSGETLPRAARARRPAGTAKSVSAKKRA